jgi:RNA polymerase sigma-70 factor (ECF subfamily)
MPEPIAYDDAAAPPADLSDVRRALHRALTRRCPRWLSDRREDIVQAALMRLVQIQQRSERNTPFPASYLWKAAYSAMIDEIRRLRRAEHVSLEDGAVDPPAVDAGSDPEQQRRAREIGAGIQECLARLVSDRRRAVTLQLVGHSVPDIAKLLGWNLKRAENLVYRGLDDLRACLTAKGLEPSAAGGRDE